MTDDVDVVVTDGFTGNVVLKTLEGGMRAIVKALFDAFGADPANQPHADALMPSLLPLYQTLDPDTYGGAVLLGRRRRVHHLPRLVRRDGDQQRPPRRSRHGRKATSSPSSAKPSPSPDPTPRCALGAFRARLRRFPAARGAVDRVAGCQRR